MIFSRPPLTADDELMRLARQWKSGAVVVSSDRKIQDAARRSACAALTADQFLEALQRHDSSAAPTEDPAAANPATKDTDSDAEPVLDKRGNPRRLSKKARRARRALGRLRRP